MVFFKSTFLRTRITQDSETSSCKFEIIELNVGKKIDKNVYFDTDNSLLSS